jgi:hypothetical protein
MCDQWLSDMDKGKINGVVFLDIRKAFDSINHKILLRKLKNQFGIQDIELKWFESYLTNREQVNLLCKWQPILTEENKMRRPSGFNSRTIVIFALRKRHARSLEKKQLRISMQMILRKAKNGRAHMALNWH